MKEPTLAKSGSAAASQTRQLFPAPSGEATASPFPAGKRCCRMQALLIAAAQIHGVKLTPQSLAGGFGEGKHHDIYSQGHPRCFSWPWGGDAARSWTRIPLAASNAPSPLPATQTFLADKFLVSSVPFN